MPTAKTATKTPIQIDDALRASRGTREAALAQEAPTPVAEVLDEVDEDPYANVACTD